MEEVQHDLHPFSRIEFIVGSRYQNSLDNTEKLIFITYIDRSENSQIRWSKTRGKCQKKASFTWTDN